MYLSIVTPIFNEEKIISDFYKRVMLALKKNFPRWNYEIIFIDDGSTDDTFDKLQKLHRKNKNVKVIKFSQNFGQHRAILAGLQFAKGDYIVVMDSDLQDRPEEITNLYKKLINDFNIIYSVRVTYNNSLFKKVTSQFFWYMLSFITGLAIPPNQSMLKIFDKKILKKINTMQEANPFLPVLFARAGMKQGIKTVKNDKRPVGQSKYTMKKMLQLVSLAFFYYSYKRLSYMLFTLIIIVELVSILLFYYNKIMLMNNFIFILLQLFFLIFTILFLVISQNYFSRIEKNNMLEKGYIIKKKLLS